ncbi:MAG TPA: histone deacetylase [Thermomicrobiales bacterium]|nr:histone deacetylase [Thermomicrobiales bacterium]
MTQLAAVLIDDAFARHDTGMHPEHPRRHAAIHSAIAGMLPGRPEIASDPASDEILLRVHTPDHLRELDAIAATCGAWVDPDTMVGPDSVDTARTAVGAAVAGINAVLDGVTSRAFALGRPPGHHATASRAMGFCLLNSIAVAAAHARLRGIEQIAIIDWDVHHGNGTQAIFEDDPAVWYASIHQSPLYPGTGAASETGRGAGEGTVCNAPMRAGSGDAAWLEAFDTRVAPFVERARPDLILLSAGYDAHESDPIGGCMVTDDGFAALTERTVALAERHCDGRLVAVLEGGYDPPALGRCVARTIVTLDIGTA